MVSNASKKTTDNIIITEPESDDSSMISSDDESDDSSYEESSDSSDDESDDELDFMSETTQSVTYSVSETTENTTYSSKDSSDIEPVKKSRNSDKFKKIGTSSNNRRNSHKCEPRSTDLKRRRRQDFTDFSSDSDDEKNKRELSKSKNSTPRRYDSDDERKSKKDKIRHISIGNKRRKMECMTSSDDGSSSEDDDVRSNVSNMVKSKSVKCRDKNHHSSKRNIEFDNEFIEEDGDKVNKRKKSEFIIISSEGMHGDDDDDYIDEDEENDNVLNPKNEECGSEDEKVFMKSIYVKKDILTNDADNIPIVDSSKINNYSNHITPLVQSGPLVANVESEYTSFITMKEYMMEQLKLNPDRKILKKSLKNCNKEIKQLILNSRSKNTRDYHNLTSFKSKRICDLEYFKKNFSNIEQLNIVKEMQKINDHLIVDKPYRLTLLTNDMPVKYKATVMQKINILDSMERDDTEYYKLKNWVDTFMRIPFMKYTALPINISDGIEKCTAFMENARKTLDDCVYGMDSTKLQILQMMGQWIANPAASGSAIAITGKMGTGKTSIIKDGVSKILGREFSFISLGGAGDSSFLNGHSYTYEGSSWGKIVQILMDSKCMNPIIYFDELDKVSDSPRGNEIINMLIHLIDSTQNNQFHDKYFSEIDFDLSKCIFFFSYNDASKVNPILRDRMYRIEVKGYDCNEKIIIAQKYLIPKIREQVNFKEGDIIIPDNTLRYIITTAQYTQNEAGVRNLKRCLEMLHTNLNLYRLVNSDSNLFNNSNLTVSFPFTVSQTDVAALIKIENTQNPSLLSMYV